MSTFRNTKSIEALSASLNRALAGARQSQVTAARRTRHAAGTTLGSRHRHQVSHFERVAARRRTNLVIGTLDRFRSPSTRWNASQRRSLHAAR
jgi:hypothetical protein